MGYTIPILGSLFLFILGYLIGVKRYMRLIAGYEPGRIKDEDAVARSFRIWCFGGGLLVLIVGISLKLI